MLRSTSIYHKHKFYKPLCKVLNACSKNWHWNNNNWVWFIGNVVSVMIVFSAMASISHNVMVTRCKGTDCGSAKAYNVYIKAHVSIQSSLLGIIRYIRDVESVIPYFRARHSIVCTGHS